MWRIQVADQTSTPHDLIVCGLVNGDEECIVLVFHVVTIDIVEVFFKFVPHLNRPYECVDHQRSNDCVIEHQEKQRYKRRFRQRLLEEEALDG